MILSRNFLAIALLSLLSSAALAQTPPVSVDAGRVGRDLDREMRQSPIAVPADLTTTQDVQAPSGSDKITLVLKRVDVIGATVLPESKIASAYADKIGKKITLTEVYGIANAITRAYRDNGYILSRAIVPKQEIGGGVVKIQIVEGFISGYAIQGEPMGGKDKIAAYARQMMASGALTKKAMERYLLMMNDLPGMKVRAVLAPSKNVAGGADMVLVVEQDRFKGNGTVDNYGNHFLGEERVTLGGQLNSLFKQADQFNGTILFVPDNDEMQYASLGYKQVVGVNGTTLGVTGSFTATKPTLPDTLGGSLGVEGQSTVLSFIAEHPFVRSRAFNLLGRASFDVTNNQSNYDTGLESLETEDNQRIVRLGGMLSYVDGFAGYNTMDATFSKGVSMFGASSKNEPALSRALGDAEFAKLTVDATRLQRLFGPFSALLGVTGQWSGQSLLASEEFGFGGSDYGRGFDYSEITGDNGLAGKVELAYSNSIEKPYLNDYQVYTFYDVGAAWNRDPGAGIKERQSGASAGIGTRLGFTDIIRGDMFVAKPLTRDVASRGEHGDDVRFKFSLGADF